MAKSAFIYDAMRTPRGKLKGGALHSIKPVDLVVGLIHELVPRNPGLHLGRIDDIVLGVVSPVGEQGACIARTAALIAGLAGDGHRRHDQPLLRLGARGGQHGRGEDRRGGHDLGIGGGVESMSRVPMGSTARR